jgi:3-phosphoshikimate 1-carboxyvinyltransferase
MIYTLKRPESTLKASVQLPASKSISNRLLIINALSKTGESIQNLSDSDDTRVMQNAINSENQQKNVGHAGTSMRFLTAYFSLGEGTIQLTGSERMKERPIGPLVKALRTLGANITYLEKEGFPPLEISARVIEGGETTIDGSISSQFISALLMIAPCLKKGLIVHLTGNIISSSYIEMTLKLMAQHGAVYKWSGNNIHISPGIYESGFYQVESDWSAASYWYSMVFAEKQSAIQLKHLQRESLQGDSALQQIFEQLGMENEFNGDSLSLNKTKDCDCDFFTYDFTNCPDIVQTMAVALCISNVPFNFKGTQTLKVKETDRIVALQTELKKLGYILESDASGSSLSWLKKRCTPEKDPIIETYHDHRMAMAFAPIALTKGQIRINDPMVVTKSYPKFWDDLKSVGFKVEEEK